MPKPNKKKSLTGMRVLALALAFITLCIAGGVTMSVLFLPAVMGANNVAKAVAPSMQVEGIDFDVTNLPQKSTMYASDGKTVIAEFYAQNREVVPLKDISKPMMQAVVAREDKRFWEHSGVDVQGVMRAFVQTYMRKGDQQGGKDISKPMMQAVVAREDKRFWEHSGVDVQGVMRAFVQTYMRKGDQQGGSSLTQQYVKNVLATKARDNWEHSGVDVQGVMRAFVQTYMRKGDQQGGSSLTQQYVKNVLATKARDNNDPIAAYHATEDTIARKLREMLISVQMEKKYSKQEILQGYLNIAQFGSNSLYGVQAAAERYFDTTADKLNVVQAATIAMITKNPSKYDPSIPENQEEAQKQRNITLQLMHDQGFITNVVQAATIAMITKNPSKYDPSIPENQEEAQKQRNITLQLMHDQGFITQKEYEEAVNTPLVDTLHLTSVSRENQEEAQKQRNITLQLMHDQGFITQKEYEEAVNTPLVDTLHLTSVSRGCMAAKYDAGYFCDYVVHKIENSPEFGKTAEDRERLLQEGGLKIVTTLDLDANAAMMDVANATIPAADSSGMEIVMASVKPGTGEVLGFGLNRTYDATDAAATDPTRSSMNYAVDQIDGGGQGFQIGSSWKPINLVAWMQQGRSINAAWRL